MNCDYQSKTQDGENSEKPTFHTERKPYGQYNQSRTNRPQGANNDLSGNSYNHSFGHKDGQNQRKYINSQHDKRQSGSYEGYHPRPHRNGYASRWQNKNNNQQGLNNFEHNDQDNYQSNHPPQRSGGNNRTHHNTSKFNYQKTTTNNDNYFPSNNIVSSQFGNLETTKEIKTHFGNNDSRFNSYNKTNEVKDENSTDFSLNNENSASDKKFNDDPPRTHTSAQPLNSTEEDSKNQASAESSTQQMVKGDNDTFKTPEARESQVIQQMSNLKITPLNSLSDSNTFTGALSMEQTHNELTSSGQTSVVVSELASPQTNTSSRNGASPDSSYRNSDISATDSVVNSNSPSTSVGDTTAAKSSTAPSAGETPTSRATSWKTRKQNSTRNDNSIERQAKSLLNKLTIENFATVIEKLAQLEEDIESKEEMQTFVNLIVSKAALERDWSEMYADLCLVLFWRSPCLQSPKINSFRMALVTKIENEYLALPEKLELTDEQKEGLDQASIELEILKIKNHIYGVVTLIGELFQRKIIPYKVLNQIVLELVINQDLPDEHFIECFVQLICTTGYFIDQNPASKPVLDLWFGRLIELKNKSVYSKRLVCVIQDVLDLRKSNWVKKIHKYTPSGLDELRKKVQREVDIGGLNYVAHYGDRKIIGKPVNGTTNPLYAAYLTVQLEKFQSKRQSNANPAPAPSS